MPAVTTTTPAPATAATTATPPPQTPPAQTPPASSQQAHASASKTPVSLLTAGGGWSPSTFQVEVDRPSGLLLLKQQEQEEECVAMVDLKTVGTALLCSEEEAQAKGDGKDGVSVSVSAGAAAAGGAAEGERRNVVNVEVGGKALVMRVSREE